MKTDFFRSLICVLCIMLVIIGMTPSMASAANDTNEGTDTGNSTETDNGTGTGTGTDNGTDTGTGSGTVTRYGYRNR